MYKDTPPPQIRILSPWAFDYPVAGSLTSTFLRNQVKNSQSVLFTKPSISAGRSDAHGASTVDLGIHKKTRSRLVLELSVSDLKELSHLLQLAGGGVGHGVKIELEVFGVRLPGAENRGLAPPTLALAQRLSATEVHFKDNV